jgi:hypothetical protein
METLAGQHHAGIGQLLVVFAHGLEKFLVRHHTGFRVLVRLDNHHESHVYLLSSCPPTAELSGRAVASLERLVQRFTSWSNEPPQDRRFRISLRS